MKKVTKTDPFTGLQFSAEEYADGSISMRLPFIGSYSLEYSPSCDGYVIPRYLFDKRETYGLNEAASILGVSKQRVSTLCRNGTLRSTKAGGIMLIDAMSVLEYREKRK